MKQFGSTDGGSSHSTRGVNILLQSPVPIVIIMLISLCNERDTRHTRGIDLLKITGTSPVWFLFAIMSGRLVLSSVPIMILSTRDQIPF